MSTLANPLAPTEVSEYVIQYNAQTGGLEKICLLTGNIVTPEKKPKFVYTLEIGNAICDLVRQGMTVSRISGISGMPPAGVVYRWLGANPDFRDKLEQARRDRAEVFHDKVLELVGDGDIHKEDVPGIKLAVDTYKWAAEKNDPERFGTRKPDSESHGPTVIMIDTGFNSIKLADKPIDTTCVEVTDGE
jgi:hypothetical protein